MTVISSPPNEKAVEESKIFTRSWFSWFQMVFVICFAQQQSGTTAERPTTPIWIGRRYFDVDLGIPIWVQSANPVVWVDATGASV